MSDFHPAIQRTATLSKAGAAYVMREVAKATPNGTINKALASRDIVAAYGSAFTPRWGNIGKAVRGGIQHVVSADSGAYYAELWSSGVGKDANWYAVTGAGIHEVEGIKKGMPLSDALRIFLASTVTKGCEPCRKGA
jgi:hypothetical protein